ncbi:hypothetical protein F4825DRAFT_129632 [Nemania diffusa]|nr:hypothetical protein F4825DRAFT_129632 [Nemania diffusa]
MEDKQEDSVISMLARQLASLEKKCIELEARCKVLEATRGAATAVTDSSIPTNIRTGGSKPSDNTHQQKSKQESTHDQNEKKGPLSRVKVIISKRDRDGEPIESEGELQTTKEEDASTHAFVLKRIIYDSNSGMVNQSEINIASLNLWNVLKLHLRWYPGHIFSESPVTLNSPFEPIVYCWDHLRKVAAEAGVDNSDKQTKDDLNLLLDTISGGSSGDEKLDKYFKMRDNYKKPQKKRHGEDGIQDEKLQMATIQFQDLWTIFPPGTLIYGKPFQGQDQVFLVKNKRITWPQRSQSHNSREFFPWGLEAWSYDWKDGVFGRSTFILNFEQFDEHRPITTLPYYPFEMHEHYESVTAKLIARGKLFQKYCNAKDGSRMFDYKGDAISEKKGFSGMKGEDTDNQRDSRSSSEIGFDFFRRFLPPGSRNITVPSTISSHVEGRVMVDYASFYQYGSPDGRNGPLMRSESGLECGCADCQGNDGLTERYRTRFDRMPKNDEWEDEQYLICPPRVLRYILREKKWAQLQVTHLTEIAQREDKDAWNSRLKLAEEDTKRLLFDLVRCHVSSEVQDDDDTQSLEVDDIVPGKGKGLVILLYGPPGVGKTSTAETIAVAAGKPLFSISVADVGTKAKHVESNLSKIFSLATHWKAILLIDEADVFLESRGRGAMVQSIDKNALVSVFLRVLEYYKGIMFLTTNQIAEFDIAIPSRIHIAIKYQSLKVDQMEDIFKGFLDNLHKHNLVDDYNEIMDWLREDVYSEGLDGRQIRNIITTALDLARADRKFNKGNNKLGKSHIKRAFNNAKNFKRDFDTQMQRYKDSQNKMIK